MNVNLELAKLFFELLKHLTTLSTVTFGFVITIGTEIFKDFKHIKQLSWTFLLLILSIILSVFSMVYLTNLYSPDYKPSDSIIIQIGVFGGWFFYIAALVSLLLFGVRNRNLSTNGLNNNSTVENNAIEKEKKK